MFLLPVTVKNNSQYELNFKTKFNLFQSKTVLFHKRIEHGASNCFAIFSQITKIDENNVFLKLKSSKKLRVGDSLEKEGINWYA